MKLFLWSKLLKNRKITKFPLNFWCSHPMQSQWNRMAFLITESWGQSRGFAPTYISLLLNNTGMYFFMLELETYITIFNNCFSIVKPLVPLNFCLQQGLKEWDYEQFAVFIHRCLLAPITHSSRSLFQFR